MNNKITKAPAKVVTTVLACCVLTVLLAAPPLSGQVVPSGDSQASAAVQETTWTGTVEQKSVDGSMAYVLNVDDESYELKPHDKLASLDGKTVSVTGTMTDEVITITTIEEANT